MALLDLVFEQEKLLLHLVSGSFTKIAQDMGKTDKLAPLIANSADGYIGPKTRTILPQAPSLIFQLVFDSGALQMTNRLGCGGVFGSVKTGRVLSHYRLRGVRSEERRVGRECR